MLKNAGLLARVKKVVRKHVNWLVASLLGLDSLADDEKKELKGFSLGKPILDFVRRSFLLGKLFAKTPKKKQKKLNTTDLDKFSKEYELTPLDDLALSYAKTQAAAFVYSVTDDMAASVLARMAKALGSSMSASVQAAVVSEAKAAVAAHKTLKEFASSLANKLQVDYKSRLVVVAQTELHRAVTQGVAQSIIQKQDVFKYGDGLESLVSIVPKPGTCPDCAKHYLDSSGNPKVMKLSSLISMGSNADPGTSHKKSRGIHTHWKTTLPPMHPRCRCEVVFIPSGFSWVNGELKLTQPRVFHKSVLMKAQESKLSPVAKPPGPPQSPKPASPGNIPGVAAPKAAGSAPASGGATNRGESVGSSDADRMVPCPFGGGADCEDNGGNGAKTHKANGSIMKKHAQALAEGAKIKDPTNEAIFLAQEINRARAYDRQDHSVAEIKSVLSNNKIIATQEVHEAGEKGSAQGKFIAVMENGGRALAKPIRTSGVLGVMVHTAPVGMGVKSEVYVSSLSSSLGIGKVPTTVEREHDGTPHSFQAWAETTKMGSELTKKHQEIHNWDAFKKEAELAGKEQELHDSLIENTALGLVTNLADQHANNVMLDMNTFGLTAIDNEAAFGTGFSGSGVYGIQLARSRGIKIELPEHITDKFDKTTFADVRASMPEARSWQVGQTLMRMKYLSYLQKSEGQLDPHKFSGIDYDVFGEGGPVEGRWGNSPSYEKRKREKTLPDDLFNTFTARWIQDKLYDDPEDPEATQLLKAGVFIEPGEAAGGYHGTEFNPVSEKEQRDIMFYLNRRTEKAHELFPIGQKAQVYSPSHIASSKVGTARGLNNAPSSKEFEEDATRAENVSALKRPGEPDDATKVENVSNLKRARKDNKKSR